MGHASKLKAKRKEQRADPAFQRAVTRERNKVVRSAMADQVETFVSDNVYMILAALVTGFGFGPVRLRRFMDHYDKMVSRMKEFYECNADDIRGPCVGIVNRAGFDLQAWEDEKDQLRAKKAVEAIKKAGDTNNQQRVAAVHPQRPEVH